MESSLNDWAIGQRPFLIQILLINVLGVISFYSQNIFQYQNAIEDQF
jgi:hypothetical protein